MHRIERAADLLKLKILTGSPAAALEIGCEGERWPELV